MFPGLPTSSDETAALGFLYLAMATLKLKKPQLVMDARPEDLTGKFAVMRRKLESKTMKFTVARDTLADAEKEATRLLTLVPGHQFAIVQFVGQIGSQ